MGRVVLILVALGESVVAIGIGLGEVELNFGSYLVAILGLLLAVGFWWMYFRNDAALAPEAMEGASGSRKASLALNGYFYSFVPMLLGIAFAAAGVAHAVGHARERLDAAHGWILAAGTASYIAETIGFQVAMGIRPKIYRFALVASAIASVPLGLFVSAGSQLAVLVVALAIALTAEQTTNRTTPVP